jgi:predicted nucleic acid-binding protein
MIVAKGLVLDANILFRAVFGNQVYRLLRTFEEAVNFYSPDVCFDDARRHIPNVAAIRNFDRDTALLTLDRLAEIVRVVDGPDYRVHKTSASARIRSRDISDWPIVATCLLLNAPLWTEDRDFFGCGLATWTTNNVGIYLRGD